MESNKLDEYSKEKNDQDRQIDDQNEKTVILETNITKNLQNSKENEVKDELRKSNGIYLKIIKIVEPIVLLTYIVSFIAISFIFFNSNIENTILNKLKTNMGLPLTANTQRLNDNKVIAGFVEELVFNITLSDFVLAEKYYVVSNLRSSIKLYKESIGNNSFIKGKTISKREKTRLSPFDYFNSNAERNDSINDFYNQYYFDESFLGTGGYVVNLNKSILVKFENKNNYDKSIRHYFQNPNFFKPDLLNFTKAMNKTLIENYLFNKDVKIGSLTYDFVMMNLEAGYIIPFYIYFDINSANVIRLYFDFNLIKINIYGGKLNTLRLVCEITFIISVIIYIFIFTSKIIFKAKKKYSELSLKERRKLEKEELALFLKKKKKEDKKEFEIIRKNINKNVKHKENNYNLSNTRSKTKIDSKLMEQFKLHFASLNIDEKIVERTESIPLICFKLLFSNIFLSISVLLSILCIIYWLKFIVLHKNIMDNYTSKFEILTKTFDVLTVNKIFGLADTLISLKLVVILNFLVLFIRIFNYVKTIIKDLNIFAICFDYALNHILSFFIIFITICLGIAVLCYFLYFQVFAFHEFLTTFMSIVAFSVLEIDEISYIEMAKENKVMTILICSFIVIFIKFIVTRIILSIILFSYSLAFDNYETENKTQILIQGKSHTEIISFLRTYLYRFVLGVSEGIVSIINFTLCIKESSQQNLKETFKLSLRNWISLRLYNDNSVKNFRNYNIIGNSDHVNEVQIKREDCFESYKKEKRKIENETDFESNENENYDKNDKNDKNDEDVSSINLKKTDNIGLKVNQENKKNKIQAIKTNDISTRDVISMEAEFNENSFNNERSIYFDSEKDTFIVNSMNERKFRNKIYLMLLFIMLFIFAIISIFYSNFNSHKVRINDSINYYTENFEIQNKVKIKDVINNYNLKEYVFEVFPKMFVNYDKVYTILNENILLHNSTLMTVKRNININLTDDEYYQTNFVKNTNSTFSNPLYIRDFTYTLIMEGYRNENKTSRKIDNDLFLEYCRNRSYKKFGGYCLNYGPKGIAKYQLPQSNQISSNHSTTTRFSVTENHSKAIIDDYTTFVILESYLYNYEIQLATKFIITFEITEGGKIETEVLTYTIKKNSSNIVSIINYVFDAIFVVSLSFYIFNTLQEIIMTYNQYDYWHLHFFNNISPEANELRQQIEHEVIRKIKSVLKIDIILNVLIITSSIIYIVFRIIVIIDNTKLNTIMNNYSLTEQQGSVDTSNDIYMIQATFSKYIKNVKGLNYSSIMFLLTSSLKFLFIIDFGKYFGLVVKTIQTASSQLMIFIIALLLTQPAFICYSYIFYGKDVIYYSTWIGTTLDTLINMFGKYNIITTYVMEKNLSALHFFLYVFIINMILINLFVSILDKAYIKTKAELKKIADEYESIYVFFFCFFERKQIYNTIKKKLENEFDYLKIKQTYKFEIPDVNDSKISSKFFSDLEVKHLYEMSDVLYFKINQIYTFESNINSVSKGLNDNNSSLKKNKELSNNYLLTFRMLLLNFMSKISFLLEKNVLDIEQRYKHLKMYSSYINFKEKTLSLANMNEEKLLSISELETGINNLIREIEKYRNVISELDNLEKDVNHEFNNLIINQNINSNKDKNDSIFDQDDLTLNKKDTSDDYFLSSHNVVIKKQQINTDENDTAKKETDISKTNIKDNIFPTKETK